jgi:hypothetical protein
MITPNTAAGFKKQNSLSEENNDDGHAGKKIPFPGNRSYF